jgi:hypothetical protein
MHSGNLDREKISIDCRAPALKFALQVFPFVEELSFRLRQSPYVRVRSHFRSIETIPSLHGFLVDTIKIS